MSKTKQRLGLLGKIKHFLPLHTQLYDYNNINWGDKNNTKLMNDPELETGNCVPTSRLVLVCFSYSALLLDRDKPF